MTVAAVAVGVVVLDGDDGDDAAPPTPSAPTVSPTVETTPLSDYDTTVVALQRASFCDAIDDETLAVALGLDDGATPAVSQADAYVDGDRAEVGGVTDVVHEFGCRWRTDDAVARGWVFAPPVTSREARALRRAAVAEEGCEVAGRAPDFGLRSVALLCEAPRGTETSFRGLFGDAWLTCSVTVSGTDTPEAELLDRTGRWCVGVAQAAAVAG
ncbi:hypothetical protein GCM10023340_17250 [Nocardioides marinquilinus]|uniref:Septum formation-related domain-containing protein n=1 Tax=Nocardioides marinquilinus TaxID=1210400 RepID=A0ABP9PIU2_9ACTN